MRKVHILALVVLTVLSITFAGCSNKQEINVVSNIAEKPIAWYKNSEINKIIDAGPAKSPFNVNMFVTGYISNDFPANKGIEEYSSSQDIEIEIEVLNTTTVPYSNLVQDLELLSFAPSITIRSGEQLENSSNEYIIRKTFPEIKEVILKPGESYSIKWTWNQIDKDGKKVKPGNFFITLDSFEKSTPITYKGKDGKIAVQEDFECLPFSTDNIKIIE